MPPRASQPVRDGYHQRHPGLSLDTKARSIRSMPRRADHRHRAPARRAADRRRPDRRRRHRALDHRRHRERIGRNRRVHILVKPTRADIMTNLVINTDRAPITWSCARREAYMASVSWQYPQDQLIALRARTPGRRRRPVASGVDLAASTSAMPRGRPPPWRPLRAFDDGRQVYVEFPRGIGQGEMPPLFVIGPRATSEIVNYRVRGKHP
jgi:hypothetical protein